MKRNEKHPIPRAALMVLGLMSQALVAQTVCAPSGLYGNSGGAANWVTVGTACGTQVPGSGRLQVQGADLTSINYALNTYMPAALNKMNYGIHALVGDELANSGQSSTGGYFESYGGTNNITGVETRSLLNHNSGISSINVVGVRSSAESRKALPGSYIHGVTADAKVATGGSAFEVNGVFGGTSGAGTITNAAGLNGLIYSGPNYTNCFGTRGEIQSATAATSSYGAYGISRGGHHAIRRLR